MPTDTRTPDQIEREIERERAELASTVDAIQDRFSPEAIIRGIADGFRDHGGDLGHAVSRSVKQNPLALAVTGVGLAWLMFGRSYDDEPRRSGDIRNGGIDDDSYAARQRTMPSTGFAESQRGTYGYPSGSIDSRSRSEARSLRQERQGRYPDWARHDLDDDGFYDASSTDDESTLGTRASDAASRAGSGISHAAGSAASGAKSTAGAVGSGVGSAASSAKASVSSAAQGIASGASHAAQSASDRAARARARLSQGTEDLTEAARERIIAARAKAVDVAQRADAATRRGYTRSRDATQDFIEEQPLVAGALAMAVGAALAGALPRSRQEDEYLGETRDYLFDEAERIFHEERNKAERVAKAAVNEASKIAEEKRGEADDAAPGEKSAVQAAADEARTAAERVKDAARDKAKDEKLGNPQT